MYEVVFVSDQISAKNAPEMVLFWKKWTNFETKSHKYSKFDFIREINLPYGWVGDGCFILETLR